MVQEEHVQGCLTAELPACLDVTDVWLP